MANVVVEEVSNIFTDDDKVAEDDKGDDDDVDDDDDEEECEDGDASDANDDGGVDDATMDRRSVARAEARGERGLGSEEVDVDVTFNVATRSRMSRISCSNASASVSAVDLFSEVAAESTTTSSTPSPPRSRPPAPVVREVEALARLEDVAVGGAATGAGVILVGCSWIGSLNQGLRKPAFIP